MTKLIELNGQVFGKLTVLSRIKSSGQARWHCRCECGNETVVPGYDLRHGLSASCGCGRAKKGKDSPSYKHGRTRTTEYMVWINMRNRCYRPNVRGYDRYGALGITVCERWRNSFENFFSDMGERPDGYTFDRIDPTGNYEPSNCRWATYEVQQTNKKRTMYATINGKTMMVKEWCKNLGLKYSTVRARISDLKWPPEKALMTPLYGRNKP
jgi:hypothetical protein